MKKSIITLSILAAVFLTLGACKCSETATHQTTNEKETMTTTESNKEVQYGVGIDDNTTLGSIVYSDKEGDCEYVIKTDDGRMLDPQNIDKSFQKDGMKVEFTFAALRMMNRCEKANPIRIIKIKAM
ncbi:hypothetical protein EAX61_10460 [Dokdonia sinensis]|uniref:Lipoprotein n=1 Tax=Dokdonia sinensis TaxID=2479847 RepID=A0A3M0G6S4_9FLAO|nr:hypothetical protein [Dokdonia sinensis]RMB58032.1 hypothetical protein EAX61_10460 [Dokdonia sinensis]